MSSKPGFSRRRFLKLAGAAGAAGIGLGSAIGASAQPRPAEEIHTAQQKPAAIKVPTRPFGKSGIDVSILSLGGMFDLAANQLMLRQAVQWGVTYWDTADCYHRGSEAGIGKYLEKFPQDRDKLFLVTKSDARDPEGISSLLARSLERMRVSTIDLYFIHGIRSIDELDDSTRRWAEKAKAEKKIRLFGFSTHSNMEACLQGAAKLGWIDGIMFTYNYRNMHSEKMKAAVQACVDAGIGLTAMKTQAGSSWLSGSEDDPLKSFTARGLTPEQAKLKAVWQNPQIASICSQMDSMKLLKANAEAASDPTALSGADMELLRRHALATADRYCTGCGDVCQAACGGLLPVAEVMRCHMYCRSYGRSDWARAQWNRIAPDTRRLMAQADFSEAESRCPQGLPVGRLVREALDDFA